MNSKIKNVSFALACVVCFVLVICASALLNKTTTAVYEGKVTSFNTSINHDTGATEFEVYFELSTGHTSAAIFYCLNSTVDDCNKVWTDAVEDGKNNGYRTFTNNISQSYWTKDKIFSHVEKGLVTDDRPHLLLFSKILLSVFVLLCVVTALPIKSKEINHA